MPFEKELEELQMRREKALQMGGPEKVKRQHQLGRLTARERIERLLDPGTFLEVGMFNCSDVPGMEDKTPADSKVAGYGEIDGRTVAIVAILPSWQGPQAVLQVARRARSSCSLYVRVFHSSTSAKQGGHGCPISWGLRGWPPSEAVVLIRFYRS